MAGFYPDDDPLSPWLGIYNPRLAGRARGSPAGGLPFQAREASPFTLTRERVQDELWSNPFLQRDFDANTTAEVGRDPYARRNYQAATIDRAVQTGQPLSNLVNNPNYYPETTTRATATTGQGVDESLWEGANPVNYATGNASYDPKTGRYVGFAGGPQTASHGGEYYGIEGQAGLPYARAMGYTGPDRTAIGPGGPTGSGDNAVAMAGGDQNATYPRREQKMPASLMDMFSGRAPLEFNPTNAGGEPSSFADALGSRSNTLIGMGLGLLNARGPGMGGALEGYQAGASADAAQAYRQQQMAHQKRQETRQDVMDRFNMDMRKQEFQRSGEGEFERLMRSQGVAPGSPEFIEQAKRYAASKIGGEWQLKDIIDPNDPEQKITVEHNPRTNEYRLPVLPGQTATAGAAAPPVNWSSGAGNAPVYGSGSSGFSATPSVGAAPAGAPGQPQQRVRPTITGATGIVYTPPAGLSKDAFKTWQGHVATTEAKIAAGEMTNDQALSSMYGGQMRTAEDFVRGIEEQGLDPAAKAKERLPWGVGNLIQSPEFQKYQSGKDAFINNKLRRQSGATIRDEEYFREERIYFPQPGDDEDRIRYKRALREDAIKRMEQAAGPAYFKPPPAPQPTGKSTPDANASPTAAKTAPARPPNVPPGSAYSPSRKQWRTPSGEFIDAGG